MSRAGEDAEKLFIDLSRVARRCGRRAADVSRGTVPFDEATQEALVWLYTHPNEVESRRDEQGDLYVTDLYFWAMRHMVPWVRKQMAQAFGQDLREQYFYTRDKVEAILPAVWTGEQLDAGEEVGVRVRTDPAIGGNLHAYRVDVIRALDNAVTKTDNAVLMARYLFRQTWDEVAHSTGTTTAAAARSRAERALDDIVDYLNGLYPVPSDGPGTRTVLTAEEGRRAAEFS